MRISDWSSDVCSSDLLALDDVDQRETVREAAARRRGADLAEQRILALYKKGWVTRAARDQTVADAAAARAAERAALARLEQHVIRAEIGRAHVCTPVTNAHIDCPTLLEKNKTTHTS